MRWLFVVFLTLATQLAAQTYPDYDRTTITDLADLLTDAEEAALDQRLGQLRDETGVELAVLTLPSQQPYASDVSLETFATGLFNHWGIGNADRNDGVLVLILPEDRSMRIELGAGYGRDWDRASANVINRSFLPAFESGNYAKGIDEGINDVIASVVMPFRDGAEPPSDPESLPVWMIGIAVALSAAIVGKNKLGDWATRLRRCPNCGRRGLSRNRKTVRHPTKSAEGAGRTVVRCAFCDYSQKETFVIPMRSSSSSSSSGSFGGGRSGGGGASGRW